MADRPLTVVGLTEDRRTLVLVSDSGEEFTLPADAKLRAVLRGDHARLGQLEITMDSTLRPREIQSRIRAGQSPEQVATAAGTTVDKIVGFAAPVLAERAHIADRAQRASVRRPAGEGPPRPLSAAVGERLSTRGIDPSAVEWDAWRRDDGRWTVTADYLSGERQRHAQFGYDAPGHYVVAEDDDARWLVGEPSASTGPQPRPSGSGGRRLSSVGSGRSEDELPLGEDALELVSEPEEPTEDLSTTVAAIRDQQVASTDWIATQASERPADGPDPADSPSSTTRWTPRSPARRPSRRCPRTTTSPLPPARPR